MYKYVFSTINILLYRILSFLRVLMPPVLGPYTQRQQTVLRIAGLLRHMSRQIAVAGNDN